MANGKFEARELSLRISANQFVVDCGQTGLLAAGVDCTQQTVRTLTLALDDQNLAILEETLRNALDGVRRFSPEEA